MTIMTMILSTILVKVHLGNLCVSLMKPIFQEE